MRNDDGHVREVRGHIIKEHRVGIFQAHATTTAQTRTHARVAAVENHRQLGLGHGLVIRVGHAVVGVKPLAGRVELEATDTGID